MNNTNDNREGSVDSVDSEELFQRIQMPQATTKKRIPPVRSMPINQHIPALPVNKPKYMQVSTGSTFK